MSDANVPPVQAPPQKTNTGLIIAIVLGVVAVPVLLLCMGILIALLLPAVQASREAARRMQCSNNLRQIAIAVHNYHETYNALPPAYTTDSEGRRLHSWRTLILPYMEQQALYNTIDLDKPWDDPVNQQAASTAVPAYHCPSSPSENVQTTYQVVIDPNSMFPGSTSVAFKDVTDGLSNTVMVVEVPDSLAVPWMSPEDCDLQEFLSYTEAQHVSGFNAAFGDGSVRFIDDGADPTVRQGIVTTTGSESATIE